MIINGSMSYTYSGRKKSGVRKVKKAQKAFEPIMHKEEPYRRETTYYPSAEITSHSTGVEDLTYKKEISKKYTVAPAYNKGAYQVIPLDLIEDIGK